jgi:hypothetical protein
VIIFLGWAIAKALAEAGLDLADDGLSFSLSDHGAEADEDAGEAARSMQASAWAPIETTQLEPGAAGPMRLYGFELAARSGLDVRI